MILRDPTSLARLNTRPEFVKRRNAKVLILTAVRGPCRGGPKERWSGGAVDQSASFVRECDALATSGATGRRIFLIMYPELAQTMLAEALRYWR